MRKSTWIGALLALPLAVQAGHFRDVPRSHWAYKAIDQLVSNGLIQGKKGNFSGHKAFTRYEMAVVLARYMEKLKTAKGSLLESMEKTYPLVKRLSREFSEELEILGVKQQELLARVTSLETRTDVHQNELRELRALVEENRRMLISNGAPLAPVTRREMPRAQVSAPRGFRPTAPYRAPQPSRQHQQSYGASAPQVPPAPPPSPTLFASAPGMGNPGGSDALRLQQLRMRARGLLSGGIESRVQSRNQRRSAPRAPGLDMSSAPRSYAPQRRAAPAAYAPARQPAPQQARYSQQPQQRRQQPPQQQGRSGGPGLILGSANYNPQSLLDTIDQVRQGHLDVETADRIAGGAEQALGAGGSQIYPLHERLFGPMGFGPPSSD